MRHHFDVADWDESLPLMQSIVEQAAADAEYMALGSWTRTDDDEALWRSTFGTVDAMLSNLDRIAPILTTLDAGPAPLSRIEFHATSDDLRKIQQSMPKITTKNIAVEFYDSGTGFQTGSVDKDDGGDEQLRDVCSSHPRFAVTDWAAAEPLIDEVLTETVGESGCLHLGWTRLGDTLQWHGTIALPVS
jgi:hypothetical protein